MKRHDVFWEREYTAHNIIEVDRDDMNVHEVILIPICVVLPQGGNADALCQFVIET
jgi:hypothetical protein